jgi:hypothetical protein
MYQPTKLIYKSYQPSQLEVGMLFAMSVTVDDVSYLHLHKLESIPRDIDKYLTENGWPIKPYLIKAIDSNPDKAPVVVAYPDQLGWIELEGLLYEFTIDDMNYISLSNEGYVYVYIDDETDDLVLEDGKAIMTYIGSVSDEDEDDDIDWTDESWQWEK